MLLWISLALIAFNCVWIVPWYLPNAHQGSGHSIRVLTFNINVANEQWDAIAQALDTTKPDIAAMIETSATAEQELTPRLAARLPSHYRTSGGRLTLFSRFPLISPRSQTFTGGTVLIASVQVNQQEVEVIVTHPIVPVKPELFTRRNTLLTELATYLQQHPQGDRILLGDFNITPWSPYYEQLIRGTGLFNTRLGFGIEPSWIEAATHVHYPGWLTALVKIPIDHILVSQRIKIADCKTLKAANSDHRILWSDVVL
jgi:endonuclease/exonuclease/phosphatase (EEP) superfamily protein YafD